MTANAVPAPLHARRDTWSGWITAFAGSWKWRLHPQVAEELQHHPALRMDMSSRDSGAVIKQGPHRTVRRFEIAGAEFYSKQFHHPDWRTRLRHLLRGSQAHWEWSRFSLATRHHIPTAEVVAIGQSRTWAGESGLITRGLTATTPLDQWINDHGKLAPVSSRHQLANRIGQLIGQMHAQGVTHLDLHAGNLLVHHDDDDFRLWLVDLSPLRFHARSATRNEMGQNLGRLFHSLLQHLHHTDQMSFFHAYWQAMNPDTISRDHRRALMRDLSRRCDVVARACWNYMDRKWARGNRKTIILEKPNLHFRGVASLGRTTLEQLCASSEQLDHLRDGDQLSISDHQFVIQRKPNRSTHWARDDWEIGHALHRRLIAAPVPGFLWQTPAGEGLALDTEPSWQPLCTAFLAENRLRVPNIVTELGNRIVDLLHRFHDLGFSHEKLSLGSWDWRSLEGRCEVRLNSLDGIQQHREPPLEARLISCRNLVMETRGMLSVRRTEWLRWLKRYLRAWNLQSWKSAWKMIRSHSLSESTRRAA